MKLTIYKTKEYENEKFATTDIECEYNIEEVKISTKALKKLFKVVPKDDFSTIIASLGTGNISVAVISQLYDIFEDKNDELLYFVRHVLIESGYYVTGEQLMTAKPEEIINLLVLMFRPYLQSARQTFKVVTKNEATQNNGQAGQQRGNNNC